MGDKGLFQMRSWHGYNYNVFNTTDNQFEGRVFDRFRRIDYKTYPVPTTDRAIDICRAIIELIAKSQCVPSGMAIHVDEGKPIREKEDKEYMKFKKDMRKANREAGKRSKL